MVSRYGLSATLKAKAGKGTDLGDILMKASNLMEHAPGCIYYLVGVESGNADIVHIFEVWETEKDHDESLMNPAVRQLISQAIPLLDGNPAAGIPLEVMGGKGLR